MNFSKNHMKMPTFFKFWFAFVALLIIGVIAFKAFVIYYGIQILSDPEGIGNYIKLLKKGIE